ncbi:hypothetical protein DPQ33_12505 [Oceanidesulfovibrio indonesiensis]|uniref:Rhodanese domain-containing protein n=1 Tax=Oceanidesulfovibrio indonesiensis TaxID=54767 RepID=A0A7M3MD39_9BACT|nr:rhodanese-like domain-containing protein [Oceanidesulfovibrio indonesiensis]TVM16430.1 hypothetical protein DPQ33_12505 [Oceanidesulfovibrio indonesiensis]
MMTHAALRVCIILMLAAVFTLGLASQAWTEESVARMDKDTLKSRLGDPGLMILDVRTNSDWNGSEFKLPGAVRLSPDDVEDAVGKLDPTKEYVLYCA